MPASGPFSDVARELAQAKVRWQRAQVDVFVRYPLAFETLWQDATRVSVDGIDVRLASPADVVRMKREAGRPKDIEDIRALGFDPEAADVDEP